MNLIPLGVTAVTLRYRQEILQATAGRNLLWCIHGDIIPSLGKQVAAGPEVVGRPLSIVR